MPPVISKQSGRGPCYHDVVTQATIVLLDDLAATVDAEARRRSTSFSEVVCELIVQGLGVPAESLRSIPWAGLFHDPGLAAAGLDDILSERWADDVDRDRG